MYQKMIAFLILVTISLFLFNASNALIVYLRPPKMIIRLNTSDTVENSLIIENRNNITIGIGATMNGDLSEIITIKNPNFDILPDETKTIDFVTKVKDPGTYSGQILVAYTTGEIEPVVVPAEITVMATKNPNPGMDIPTIPILLVILILAIIASVVLIKRGRV